MDQRTSTRSRFRTSAVRALAVSGAGALMLAALPGTAGATGGQTWHVKEGESIQAAVDRASSGDTIKIAPGVYEEAVCIEGKGLTIQGSGRERTKIVWDRTTTNDEIEPRACWTLTDEVDQEDAEGIADNVSGLFFLDPDSPVVVKDLQTRDHTANGINAWNATGFTVTGTKGVGHDRYGIIAGNSRDIHIVGNVEEGVNRSSDPLNPDAGTAGISVGDSDNSRSVIAGNRVRGYNLGIFLREANGGHVKANHLSGNCIGILTFDDSATEIPGSPANVIGGNWKLTANVASGNNRYCLQGRDGNQRISGVGMAVVNATGVQVTANAFLDNKPRPPQGAGPLTFPSGGLVLLTFPPPPSTDPNAPPLPDPGPVDDVDVVANWFGDNQAFRPIDGNPQNGFAPAQMDIYVGDPADNPFLGVPGTDLQFRHNRCDASYPTRICRP
jgi:hypothetical protein